MFISIKTKIIVFITLIVAAIASAMIYFTHRDVGSAMLSAEETSARNVLELVELSIKSEYKKLLQDKVETILNTQRQLRSMTAFCASILEQYSVFAQRGLFSEQEAQERALNWFKAANFAEGHAFVFEKNGLVVAHSDSYLQGTSIASLQDIKGRSIVEVMREDVLEDSGDSAVFYWTKPGEKSDSKKLGYFIPFAAWHWTVGAVVDIGDVELETRKKVKDLIEVLENSFAKIQIAENGYIFLFNGAGEMLIPPPSYHNDDYSFLKSLLAENVSFLEPKTAVRNAKDPPYYVKRYTRNKQHMIAHISYFKAFDWYIAVALPVEEIQLPAKELVNRQSVIIGTIFFCSLFLAFILVSKISRPLKVLARHANELPYQDFSSEETKDRLLPGGSARFKDEVTGLSESFAFMEAELRKNVHSAIAAETKSRTILESIEEGFFETSLTGRMVYFNDSICKITGYSRDELVGSSRNLTIPEAFSWIKPVFEQALQATTEPVQIRDLEITRKDGTKRVIELSIYIVRDQEGSPSGYRGVIRDVTERLKADKENRKLEAQLQRAQKMEAIGTLAGGIAHDFNNVLSVILGYSELIMVDIAEGSRAQKNLNEVLNAAKRATDLVQQILTFSRQTEEEFKPVQFTPIIKETCKFLRASLPSTVKIRPSIQAESDVVLSDATKIHQILMNLCTNASHAMSDKGGVLELILSSLDLRAPDLSRYPDLSPGPYLRLTVRDSGHGMDKSLMERIFDPYFTTKEKGKGTGLGLAVVLGIAKNHGGTVTVHSEPEKGTTFEVYLPRIEPSETDQAPATEPLPKGTESVLFVDDEEALLDMGKQMLERLGYKVFIEKNSIRALEIFRAHPDKFDLVITDLTMPDLTGTKLASELLAIRADIPIVLCTGFSTLITEEKAKAIGVREFVMKPLVMRDLATTIRNALDGQKA